MSQLPHIADPQTGLQSSWVSKEYLPAYLHEFRLSSIFRETHSRHWIFNLRRYLTAVITNLIASAIQNKQYICSKSFINEHFPTSHGSINSIHGQFTSRHCAGTAYKLRSTLRAARLLWLGANGTLRVAVPGARRTGCGARATSSSAQSQGGPASATPAASADRRYSVSTRIAQIITKPWAEANVAVGGVQARLYFAAQLHLSEAREALAGGRAAVADPARAPPVTRQL